MSRLIAAIILLLITVPTAAWNGPKKIEVMPGQALRFQCARWNVAILQGTPYRQRSSGSWKRIDHDTTRRLPEYLCPELRPVIDSLYVGDL